MFIVSIAGAIPAAAQQVTINLSFDSAGYVVATPPVSPPTGAHPPNTHVVWVSTVAGCHPIVQIDDDGAGDPWKQPNCNGNDKCEANTPHKHNYAGTILYKYFARLACANGNWSWVDPEIAIAGDGRNPQVHHPRGGGSAKGNVTEQHFRDASGHEYGMTAVSVEKKTAPATAKTKAPSKTKH